MTFSDKTSQNKQNSQIWDTAFCRVYADVMCPTKRKLGLIWLYFSEFLKRKIKFGHMLNVVSTRHDQNITCTCVCT